MVATIGVKIDATQARTGGRIVKREMDEISRKARGMEQAVARSGRAANDNFKVMERNITGVKRAMSGLVTILPGLAAGILAAFSIGPVLRFKDAIAEVSTLVDTATFSVAKLEKAALSANSQFGGGAANQAKALYQIISAGAASAAEATDILNQSNKLAVGGVTEVATAADGLTSVLNAYGDKVESAAAVSDAMFVAMRAGKTTIGELSSNLGKVAPLAAQMGVSFDELAASVAALTKGGISTSESITGVRAILAAVAKPGKEAKDIAEALGLQFDSAAIKAKGFSGFLQDVKNKTGGSTDALALLFGGVEAIVPMMALSGSAGKDFADIMDQMAVKAGQTDEAVNKMANSPGFQIGRVWGALESEVIKLGSSLGSILVPILKTVADQMENVFKVIKIVGAGLLVAFAPAIFSQIAAGFTLIGTTAVAAMRLITAAIAANPLGALLVGITLVITAIYQFRDRLKEIFGVDVPAIINEVAAAMYGGFKGAYDTIIEKWRDFPAALGDLVIQAAQGVINTVTNMVNSVLDLLNSLPGIDDAGNLSAPQIPNPFSGRAADVGATFRQNVLDATQAARDYLSVEEQITDTTRTAADAQNEFNDALDAARAKADAAAKGLGETAKATKDLKDKTEEATDVFESTYRDAFKGLFTDTLQGLREGKSLWEAFGDAAVGALEKIANKMLDVALDNIFDILFKGKPAAEGGGLFGPSGSFGGLMNSIFGGGGVRSGSVGGGASTSIRSGTSSGGSGAISSQAAGIGSSLLRNASSGASRSISAPSSMTGSSATQPAHSSILQSVGKFDLLNKALSHQANQIVSGPTTRGITPSSSIGNPLSGQSSALNTVFNMQNMGGLDAMRTVGGLPNSVQNLWNAQAMSGAWSPFGTFGPGGLGSFATAGSAVSPLTAFAGMGAGLPAMPFFDPSMWMNFFPFLFGFAKGGYTGMGRDNEIAGVAHRNEYVFDADSTRRIGVQNLERIRSGDQKPMADGPRVFNQTVNFNVSERPMNARSQNQVASKTGRSAERMMRTS